MSRHVLLCTALAIGAGGCLYLPAINGEPDAAIEKVTAGPIGVDPLRDVVFRATSSTDPDGSDDLIARWRATWCNDAAATDCPPGNDFALDDGAVWEDFTIRVTQRAPIRVTLVVEDRRGATDSAELVVDVVNQPAEFDPDVQGYQPLGGTDYMIGTPIDIIPRATDADGDELTLGWELFEPIGSTPSWEPNPDLGVAYRLIPDLEGLYQVRVTADDGADVAETLVPILVVADQPPCLKTLAPLLGGTYPVDRDGGPWTATVNSVIDDLDFWPMDLEEGEAGYYPFLDETVFSWQVASPDTGGELVAVEGLDASSYLLDPSVFAPGDVIQIRVEVADRVDRSLPCAADAPTCSIGGDECLQRATWEVEIR